MTRPRNEAIWTGNETKRPGNGLGMGLRTGNGVMRYGNGVGVSLVCFNCPRNVIIDMSM